MSPVSVSAQHQRCVPGLVSRHAEEASFLWDLRRVVACRNDLTLAHLLDTDERLEAHLDGLRTAGATGRRICDEALGLNGPGEEFASTLLAIEAADEAAVERNLSIAQANPAMRPGALSAFGWASPRQLRGIVRALIDDPVRPFHRMVGIAACAMHRADPGRLLADAVHAEDAPLRRRALKACGELGRTDLLDACLAALRDEDAESRAWAAWSAVLLGDRQDALEAISVTARHLGDWQARASRIAFGAMTAAQARADFAASAANRIDPLVIVDRAGFLGDVAHVPRLIELMRAPAFARLAGRAFSLITGANLEALQLSSPASPEGDSPALDGPIDLLTAPAGEWSLVPWPDADRVADWWSVNAGRFPAGEMYFMGAAPSVAHCVAVLETGFQHQRSHAAEHLCLLEPGSKLFNVAAPAWRQKSAIVQMPH